MSITGSEQWMYSSGGEFYPYSIDYSVRLGGSDGRTGRLKRTFSATGNRQTFTMSCWLKRNGRLANDVGIFYASDGSNEGNSTNVINFKEGKLQFRSFNQTARLVTNQLFRDTSAWYHIVAVSDTTNATADDRMRLYVNGEQVTSFQTRNNPSQNLNWGMFNSAVEHGFGAIGKIYTPSSDYYLSECYFVDGQALDPTSFGEFKSGIWIAKEYTGSYGTNGFKLAFQDSGALGDDTSGNGHDFTSSDLAAHDQMLDNPTNNFAVLRNMGTPPASGAGIKEGNLHYTTGSSGSGRSLNRQAISTILPTSGKWYAECRVQSSANQFIGVGPYQVELSSTSDNTRYSYIRPLAADVYTRTGSSETLTSNYGSAGAVGDVFGVYLDLDASTPEVYYSKNGSWGDGSGNFDEATPTTAITLGDSFLTTDNGGNQGVGFIFSSAAGGTSVEGIWNFGQDSTFAGNEASGGNTDANGLGDFFSTVPDGALSLCSANLPTGAIDTAANETPEDYFNTILYTGDGNTGRTVTGVGFQPDFAWIKERSSTSGHILSNAIAGSTKLLTSNTTDAEATDSNKITSFDSDGYTLGSSGAVNQSSQTYVGWNWKANGAGVSNTDGSITSTVSAGATSQQNWFSIVSYTGNGTHGTIGHGLSGLDMLIVKDRSTAENWAVWHSGIPITQYLRLNSTNAAATPSRKRWNDTSPTSTVFSVGDSTDVGDREVNQSGENYIAYCFANAEGLCKAGSYTGNGSTDGTFVFTGHRAAYVMLKRTDSAAGWNIIDAERSPINPNDKRLEAQGSGAEGTNSAYNLDFLSNGFKLRTTNPEWNASGGSYIFISISEQPFKYANAR